VTEGDERIRMQMELLMLSFCYYCTLREPALGPEFRGIGCEVATISMH
jgi:hypothetical protein